MPMPGWYRRCMAASSATFARRRAHRVAGISRTHRKISVKLPVELLDDIEDRVGPGNVSRYLAESVAEGERRKALVEWLEDFEDRHGPISTEEIDQARQARHEAIADRET